MDTGTPIIVKRGLFSTLAYGVSGVLITGIICGTGVGLYGMRMLDRKSGDLTALAKEIVAAVPDIIAALPPVLADALNDRRDPGYRSDLEIDIAIRQDPESSRQRPVLTIKNNGDQVVSLLGLRVVRVDQDGLPVEERSIFPATPPGSQNIYRQASHAPVPPRPRPKGAEYKSRHPPSGYIIYRPHTAVTHAAVRCPIFSSTIFFRCPRRHTPRHRCAPPGRYDFPPGRRNW